MAHYDGLTGLPNRILFSEGLERTLARLRGENTSDDLQPAPALDNWMVAVLFLDLDNFKDVNDDLGHAIGDELLRLVAARLGHCLRVEDILARLGGDEFAVLLEGIATPEQAAEVAQRMVGAVSAPFGPGRACGDGRRQRRYRPIHKHRRGRTARAAATAGRHSALPGQGRREGCLPFLRDPDVHRPAPA